jgi:membrane-bound lytic murein transglycosylase B
MSAPRRWARRAVLSLLAGSGLTAAGLGSGSALAAETTTATTGTTETPPPPVTETTPQPSASETPASQPASSQPAASTTSTATTPSSTSSAPPASTAPVAPAPTGADESPTAAPTVVVQRKQRPTGTRKHSKRASSTGVGVAQGSTPAASAGTQQSGPATVPAGTPNGVAPAPQAVGGEAGALASLFNSSAVSAQALDFYRIPLFLLPIYQAAAVQYDVPWQILAGINEVETDFGSDLSVSTAGAVGWMQFMPQTWLQYGVDATSAGYADPYNPVDAIFAAARYLHAAGASHNLHRAILAYNHSQAYVEAVMLRARLIATYPHSVIGTLTGLVDGRLPTVGAHAAPGTLYLPASATPGANGQVTQAASAGAAGSIAGSSATAGAVPASPLLAGASVLHGAASAARATGSHRAAVPGSTPPPPPQVVAARAEATANAPAKSAQLMDLLGKPSANVVAVQSGRVVHLGDSRSLGRYLVLRDVYGDIFTYAGLGDIAPRYRRPKPPAVDPAQRTPGSLASQAQSSSSRDVAASTSDPTPTLPASAGHQLPVTLKVKAHHKHAQAPVETEVETAPAGAGKVRLYAHPHNPLARAVAARTSKALAAGSGPWLPLRRGALVSQGTVLGQLPAAAPGASTATLRFAVRPAGDDGTIDPRTLLANWRMLGAALHPRGAKGRVELLGATADQVFAMSKDELQRSVLSDPGVKLDACGRRDVAEGAIDRRALGVLEFLSRSGLQPTVGALQCAHGKSTAAGTIFEHFAGGALDITAINDIPIAGHQGPGTVTDATIRALLSLPIQFVPHRILSLMEYPHAPNTLARTADWNRIRIGFAPVAGAGARAARARHTHKAQSSLAASGSLDQEQWNQLITRIAALPQPSVAAKPSASAIRDPQAAPTNRGLGARGPAAGA